MFERFTTEARAVVAGAQHETRTLRSPRTGTEHLLLALVAQHSPRRRCSRGTACDPVTPQPTSPGSSAATRSTPTR